MIDDRVSVQESAAPDSYRSRTVTGITTASSALRARLRWSAEASSPTPKTSFARNVPSRNSCERRWALRQSATCHHRYNNIKILIITIKN